MPYEVVFTDSAFCSFLEHIASDLPTGYNNIPYYNCGYYTGTKWTFDCWNLIKSVIWGWNADTTEGSYTYNPGLHGLDDLNGIQLLNSCTNVSTNFTDLNEAEYLYYHGSTDHAGVFIGNRTINNRVVNVVECTPIWNGGVQYSYIDSNGVRYEYQGAPPSITWTAHGKLPWIDYTGQPVPPSPPTPPTPPFTLKKLPIWLLLRYHF